MISSTSNGSLQRNASSMTTPNNTNRHGKRGGNNDASATMVASLSSSSTTVTPSATNTTSKRQKKTASSVSKTQLGSVPKMPKKGFCLIWICTHGKGRRRTWRKQDLKIVGTFATKAGAEDAKQNLMRQYDCCGHGDILVGDTWDDEIDLVIRETELHF